MKKLLSIFALVLFVSESALAITLPARGASACKYDSSFFTPATKENLNYNGKNYLVQQRFGNYYVNGEFIGLNYDKSYKNNELYINGKLVSQYGLNVANNSLVANSVTTLFLQAYTKFSMKDYEGASDDCRKILALDPNHRKATVLLALSDGVLANKLSTTDAQVVSENSLSKIIQGAEKF